MQSAAPELVDLSQESQATLDMYGVDRPEPTDVGGGRSGGTLIKDLKQRGLLDSTLLVFAGEFGRTPLAENRGGTMSEKVGRDHHPFAFSVWMAGGGFKGGLTYGQTDEIGWSVAENPVHVNDLHATILNQFGFDHRRLAVNYKGLSVRLTDQGGKVVSDLLS
jgi:uncharacterized protein (DUF1501 family)